MCDMLHRLVETTAPAHHGCLINEQKVSLIGFTTIDCIVMASIVFKEVRTNDSTSP